MTLHLLVEVEAIKGAVVCRRLLFYCNLYQHRRKLLWLVNILILAEAVLSASGDIMLCQQMPQVVRIDIQEEIPALHAADTGSIAVMYSESTAFEVDEAVKRYLPFWTEVSPDLIRYVQDGSCLRAMFRMLPGRDVVHTAVVLPSCLSHQRIASIVKICDVPECP